MLTPPSDPREEYRRAELRLRVLLLGDENGPGVVRGGEELRLRVQAELRHMRHALDELAAALESRPAPKPTSADLLRPAEAARALGVDVSWVYRAVRNGDVHGVRLPTRRRRGSLRIPAGEVRRIAGSSASRRA